MRFLRVICAMIVVLSIDLCATQESEAQTDPEVPEGSTWIGRIVVPAPNWRPVEDGREDWLFLGRVTSETPDRVWVDCRVCLSKADALTPAEAELIYSKAIDEGGTSARAFACRAAIRLQSYSLKEALSDTNAALAIEPAKPQYRALHSRVLAGLGQEKEADAEACAVVDAAPDSAAACWTRGKAHEPRFRSSSWAFAWHSDALHLDPYWIEAYVGRALAHIQGNRFDQALSDLETAEGFAPPDAQTAYVRAMWHARQKQFEEAIAGLGEAIRRDRNFLPAYHHRADISRDQSKYALALLDLTEILRLDPDNAERIKDRGWARLMLKDDAGAIEDYTRVVQLNPEDATAYSRRGISHSNRGELDAALEDLNRGISLSPEGTGAAALLMRAEIYVRKSEIEKAVSDLTKATTDDFLGAEAYRRRSEIYVSQREFEKAEHDLNTLVRLAPSSANAWAARAKAHLEMNRREDALEDAEKSLQINRNPIALSVRARARELEGDLSGALADYDEAIRRGAIDQQVVGNRGYLHATFGEHDLAIADFTKAIKQGPERREYYRARALSNRALGRTAEATADDKSAAAEKTAEAEKLNR